MFILEIQLWMLIVAVCFVVAYLLAVPAYSIKQHIKLANKWRKHSAQLEEDNQRLSSKVGHLETSLNHCMEVLAKNQGVFRTVAQAVHTSELPAGVKIKLISELPIVKQEK